MHDTFLYLQTHNGLGLENESFEHLYEHFPIYTMVSEFAGPYDKQPIPPVSAAAPRAPSRTKLRTAKPAARTGGPRR